MKRHQWIVCGLAVLVGGICGQRTALGLGAVYDFSETVTLKVAGVHPASGTSTGTFAFNDDGTFDLSDNGDDFTGNYTVVKNGKQVEFALDDASVSLLENVIIDGIESIAEGGGVTLQNVTLAIKKMTIANATIKNGNPVKTTVTVSGKVSADVDGKSETRSFSYKSVIVFQQ